MFKIKNTILLEGSIFKGLLLFSVPILFSLLFQTLYNTVDTILIGYFLGDVSLGAIGVVTPIFDLIVGFCSGVGSGFAIITGQAFGARDFTRLKKSVGLSLILSFGLGVLLTIVSVIGLPYLLHLLQTPDVLYDQALSYILVIIYGLLISILYNLEAAMLRAIGDSMTPLVILGISCMLNIFFDYFAIVVLNMGIAGAAYATVFAQLISAVVCAIWIVKKRPELFPSAKDYAWDKELVLTLSAQGLSMGLMSSIVSVGSVILQYGINGLGQQIVTAHTAARRVYQILILPLIALMTTQATFVAQNMGAGAFERIEDGIRKANRLDLYYCIIVLFLAYLFGGMLVGLLSGSSDPIVLENGALYLKTNSPFFICLGILLNLRSSLQGLGKKIIPVISSIVELVMKILFTFWFIPLYGYLGVCFTEPACWTLMTIYLIYAYKTLPLLKEHGVRPRVF